MRELADPSMRVQKSFAELMEDEEIGFLETLIEVKQLLLMFAL